MITFIDEARKKSPFSVRAGILARLPRGENGGCHSYEMPADSNPGSEYNQEKRGACMPMAPEEQEEFDRRMEPLLARKRECVRLAQTQRGGMETIQRFTAGGIPLRETIRGLSAFNKSFPME